MARHETEMRRQRDEMHDALRRIIRAAEASLTDGGWMTRLELEIAGAKAMLAKWQKLCPNTGLFADHSQMDLQDRKDLT